MYVAATLTRRRRVDGGVAWNGDAATGRWRCVAGKETCRDAQGGWRRKTRSMKEFVEMMSGVVAAAAEAKGGDEGVVDVRGWMRQEGEGK